MSHEGSKSVFLFCELLYTQLKHMLVVFKYPYPFTTISVVISYISFIISFPSSFFLLCVLEYCISCWILFSSYISNLWRCFCFISIFSAGYISPNILSAEILFSRRPMLLDSSQMLPNVLKAILDYRDFLSSFSTVITYMQTLQPLLTHLAILMSSILPFLFPVRKTGCIAPILLIHKANLLFKRNHYYILFFSLKFPQLPLWNTS